MKLLSKALLTVAFGVMAAVSHGQILSINHWVAFEDNYIANPGFESGLTDWNTGNCYFEGDEVDYEPLCSITGDSHSGKYALDMYQGYSDGYNGFYHAEVSQTLSTPVTVSSLMYGSIWCQSGGNYLNMVVTYTDNTSTFADFYVDSESAAPGNNGYVQWNFLSLLNQSKTVKAIDFWCNSFDGSDITIDDVTLATLVWFYIP